jgi:hypothetical protein
MVEVLAGLAPVRVIIARATRFCTAAGLGGEPGGGEASG